MYDFVSDTPASTFKVMADNFGKLRTMLFWLHSFEEPFYSCKDFELLGRRTLFEESRIRFVGLMCCLILTKELQVPKNL